MRDHRGVRRLSAVLDRSGVARAALASAVVAVAVLGGCADSDSGSRPEQAPSAESAGGATLVGEPEVVASGLDSPWSIAFTAGGTPLVSERDSGRVLEVLDGGGTREAGVVAGVRHGGEGGLLGLAVDGQGHLYAYSTGMDGVGAPENRIQRIPLTGGPGAYRLGEAETILGGLPAAAVHNGGRIAFGPDGMLYAGVGDAAEPDRAQDLNYLGGKILRMTPDGAVPADNPIDGSLVYSFGHRNVQGLAWAADGTMFASEFGQNTRDELNVIVPAGNYGWPTVEGLSGKGSGGEGSGFVEPVQEWAPADASPSGLAIVDGVVFLANLRGRLLRAVPVAAPGSATEHLAGEFGRLRDVVAAPDGDLWILTNNTDGRGNPSAGDDKILSVAVR